MKRVILSLSFIFLLPTLFLSTQGFATPNKNDKEKNSPKKQLQPWEVDTLIQPIPINRQLFVDHVKKALGRLDAVDGLMDRKVDLEGDTMTSRMLSHIFFHDLPLITIHIENLTITHPEKIRLHKALTDMINRFVKEPMTANNVPYFKNSAQNFEQLMIAVQANKLNKFLAKNTNLYTLDNAALLDDYPEQKAKVFEAVGMANPTLMINRLKEFAGEPYADPIVAAAARVVPSTVLTYATSTSYLSSVIRRNQDPIVQTIVKIADQSKNPLKTLPFLGPIYKGQMTIAEADAAQKEEATYFKSLVAAALKNDTIGRHILEKEIDYRGLQLVRVVNALHENPSSIRFASIQSYSAPELYFMILGSQDEIYTSSFTYMANRLLEKMKPQSGDDFLKELNYYRFRTWIRMSAGYNTLEAFFATMTAENKNHLMKDFVANLEQGPEDDLTDAVDVADAFGSMTDPKLMKFLENEITKNYERNKHNEKGTIIYGLLSTIVNNSSNSQELTGRLSVIPPITYVPYDELVNDKGEVIIQTFFYGDVDGRMSFNSFQSNFPASNWTKTSNQYWVKYTYKGNHKVEVYANLPGEESRNEDATAQEQLQQYLSQNHITPTIVIHRGHSYHLEGSLKNLTPKVKVVMLGSCGGYHNLANVLDKSPDANIISSKQVGAMSINEPIIKELLKHLTKGENIDWIESWSDLTQYFSNKSKHEKDLFSDYIPPNRNLGAIFIKAYRSMRAQLANGS